MAPLFPQASMIPNSRDQWSLSTNQVPAMSINIPSMLQQNNTPNPVLVGVHGFDSVKQFPTKPNQTVSLHDLDADFEYIIDTDVNNQPSYKILEYNQITEEEYKEKYSKAVNKISTLPSVEEYNKLVQEHNEALKRIDRLEKEVSENAKQSIRNAELFRSTDKPADTAIAGFAAQPGNTRDISEVKSQ